MHKLKVRRPTAPERPNPLGYERLLQIEMTLPEAPALALAVGIGGALLGSGVNGCRSGPDQLVDGVAHRIVDRR